MNFLMMQLGPLPVWAWGLGVVGGVATYIIIRRRNASSSGSTLGQAQNTTPPDPNIDPNTGVPYSVESATDPNTGVPYYYEYPGGNAPSGQNVYNSPANGSMSGGPVGPPQAPPPGPTTPANMTLPPAAPPITAQAVQTAGQTVSPTTAGGGPVGPPGPGIAPGSGPKGPPQPGGPGVAQAPGTPLQQGGKFRGSATYVGPFYGTARAHTWPLQQNSLDDIYLNASRGVPFEVWKQGIKKANPQIGTGDMLYPGEQIRV